MSVCAPALAMQANSIMVNRMFFVTCWPAGG
jgi:hypothetical protein